MTEYTSSIQQIPYAAERVFSKLSDLSNLENIKALLGDKVKDFRCDQDSCFFRVDPVGLVGVRVLERDANKTIKIQSVDSPVEFFGWVQLAESDPDSTDIRLTLRADLPIFLKAMLSGKIEDGLEKVVSVLARLAY
jgi:hypothetical protein